MERLKKIIRGRPVIICLGGKSIAELSVHMDNLRAFDICWMGLNLFQPAESILRKVHKKFDLLYDSTSDNYSFDYLPKIKIPRLTEFLHRPDDNLLITTHGIVRDFFLGKFPSFYESYKSKIFVVDDVFPKANIGDWMSVPNSATLAIAAAYAGGASKIILLGCDGMGRKQSTYYMPELHAEERIAALGHAEDTRIDSDFMRFERDLPVIIEKYQSLFDNKASVFNCSPDTMHRCLPILSYDELLNKLRT